MRRILPLVAAASLALCPNYVAQTNSTDSIEQRTTSGSLDPKFHGYENKLDFFYKGYIFNPDLTSKKVEEIPAIIAAELRKDPEKIKKLLKREGLDHFFKEPDFTSEEFNTLNMEEFQQVYQNSLRTLVVRNSFLPFPNTNPKDVYNSAHNFATALIKAKEEPFRRFAEHYIQTVESIIIPGIQNQVSETKLDNLKRQNDLVKDKLESYKPKE